MAEEEFAPTGLAPSYAFVLMTINSQPGIQPKELSMHMQLAPSTVTRLVDKLELKGFLERKITGRSTGIYPTQTSLDLNDKIKESWQKLYARYSSLIGETEGIELTQKINSALANILK
jgi:DNA-binding MarR family transcriptional regulator